MARNTCKNTNQNEQKANKIEKCLTNKQNVTKSSYKNAILFVLCWLSWGLLDLDILTETLLENAGCSFEVGINYR